MGEQLYLGHLKSVPGRSDLNNYFDDVFSGRK